MKRCVWVVVCLACLAGQGCASIYKPPQPWERDILAQDKMQLGGDPVETGIDDKIYFSKESSTLGRSIGGGGCGCN